MRRRPQPPRVPLPRALSGWSPDCRSPERFSESIQEALAILGKYQAKLTAGLIVILTLAILVPAALSEYLLAAIIAVSLILAASTAFALEVFQAFTWTAFFRSLRFYITNNRDAVRDYCSESVEA